MDLIGDYKLEFDWNLKEKGYTGNYFGALNFEEKQKFNDQMFVDLRIVEMEHNELFLKYDSHDEFNNVLMNFTVPAKQIEKSWAKIVD